MALAAVPVIYAGIHFRAAVLAVQQAEKGVDFPVPVGPFDRRVFQYALDVLKGGAVDDGFMHVLRDVPLAPVYIILPVHLHILFRTSPTSRSPAQYCGRSGARRFSPGSFYECCHLTIYPTA